MKIEMEVAFLPDLAVQTIMFLIYFTQCFVDYENRFHILRINYHSN